jgi:hypothetical protein
LADFTNWGLPKNYRCEGDVLGLAEPHGTECKLLETNYSNFVVIAMKVLTFSDLFSFFLWKTWRVKNELRQRGRCVGTNSHGNRESDRLSHRQIAVMV